MKFYQQTKHVSLKRISKNFVWLLFGNTISQCIVFISFIKIASILPPDDFGRFAFAQSIINFLTRFTEFGLETIAVRRITKDHNFYQLFEHISFIRLSLSLIVIIPILSLYIYENENIENVIMLILSLSMVGISFSTEWYYLAIEKMRIVAIIRIIRACAFYIPLAVLLSKNPTSIFVSWVHTISFISINFIVFYLFITNKKIFTSGFSIHTAWHLVKESYPIGLASTLMQIPYYYSTFIIGVVLTNVAVANFSAAYRPVLAIWSFGIMALYNAIFPSMNNYANDVNRFSSFIYKLSKIFILSGVLFLLIFFPVSDKIIFILYGGKYLESVYILKYSLFIIAIVLSRTAMEYSLVSIQLQKEYTAGISLVSLLYIIFCSIGVYYHEIIGALVGCIISEVLYTGYIIYQIRKYNNNVPYIVLYGKSIIIVILPLMIFYNPFNVTSLVVFLLYVTVIVIGLFVLKFITIDDLKYLKTKMRRN